jgi:hypothetical protein
MYNMSTYAQPSTHLIEKALLLEFGKDDVEDLRER